MGSPANSTGSNSTGAIDVVDYDDVESSSENLFLGWKLTGGCQPGQKECLERYDEEKRGTSTATRSAWPCPADTKPMKTIQTSVGTRPRAWRARITRLLDQRHRQTCGQCNKDRALSTPLSVPIRTGRQPRIRNRRSGLGRLLSLGLNLRWRRVQRHQARLQGTERITDEKQQQ